MRKFLLSLGLSVLLMPLAVRAADETEIAKPLAISQITVQRTWCYGACPIDSVTFNSNGSATYSGFDGAAPRRGFYNGKLTAEQFADLAAFLESQNYFELKPEIGQGNIDAPDFLVSVTRANLPYNVTFRSGNSQILEEKMKKTLLAAVEQIGWQRNEEASKSGVRGSVRRPLTRYEAASLRDRKPPVKSFPMKFALVSLRPSDSSGVEISTRSDQEGRFQFFAPPGRYHLSVTDSNFSQRRRLDDPLYLAPSQFVIVEAEKFAAPTLMFEDKNRPPR